MIRTITIIVMAEIALEGSFCKSSQAIPVSEALSLGEQSNDGSLTPADYYSNIALIYIDGVPKCSGTFIDLRIILTAANCVKNVFLERITVKVSSPHYDGIEKMYNVVSTGYSECPNGTFGCEAGLIQLNEDGIKETNRIMKLPDNSTLVPEDGTLTLVGWDTSARSHVNGAQHNLLHKVDLEIDMSSPLCIRNLNDSSDESLICASSFEEKFPREYLGGPLLVDKTVIGVASLTKKIDHEKVLLTIKSLTAQPGFIDQLFESMRKFSP